jgi:NTP pyrophosphatase (non-canonical NTP hydrolase)
MVKLFDKSLQPVLKDALESFGYDIQKEITIEEMAELTKELIKEKRHEDNFDKVIEEIADVYIMICQLIITYGENQVEAKVISKMNRLTARIELWKEKDLDLLNEKDGDR